jgi:hypothetical protein
LVAIDHNVVNLFMKLGEEIARALPVPLMSALSKGLLYLVEAPKVPAGLGRLLCSVRSRWRVPALWQPSCMSRRAVQPLFM